jgi:aryl-alcohol dehydrogenase-like predicted oxidoreductase
MIDQPKATSPYAQNFSSQWRKYGYLLGEALKGCPHLFCRVNFDPAAATNRRLLHRKLMATSTTSQLRTRQLGNSDMHITRIGFGAWAIGGGDWQYSWGHQEDADSVSAIERALDLGINWIDTAAIYGLGHSEEVVARALKQSPHQPYIFTKCSMRWDGDRKIYRDLKAASVRQEAEASLRRLNIDVIDLYQIHWPDPDAEIEEGWETMAKLQQEGKVRHIGVSNFNVRQMERAAKIAPITSLQPPYSIVHRGVEVEILPWCQKHGIGVINYSPMASGLLTGKMTADRVQRLPADDWRRRDPQFNSPKLEKNLAVVEQLAAIGEKHGVEPGVVAVAYTLHHPAVTAAIVGARRPDQIDGTIAAASFALSDAEYQKLRTFVEKTLA